LWEEGCLGENVVQGPDYIALTAAEKYNLLWENIIMDTESVSWPDDPSGLFSEDMCLSLHQEGDKMPVDSSGNTRTKFIHTVGSVGTVEFISSGDHPYTGLFTGAKHGLMRVSLGEEPDRSRLNTIPGMGLKFLRDGREAGGLVAMVSVVGQESWNIFKNDWSNHLPPLPAAALDGALLFATATPLIQYVGLSDMARFDEDGWETPQPTFPFKLVFKPNPEIQNFPDEFHGPFTDVLATIPKGILLFKVYAWDAPSELGGTEQLIGEIMLRKPFTTSRWGDEKLFFRHQNMMEDVVMQPSWREFLNEVILPGRSQSCPSAAVRP